MKRTEFMEHVQGRTLDQLIPRHGMRLNEALKVSVQMANALAATHAVGIVHRISSRLVRALRFHLEGSQRDGVKGRGVSHSTVAKHRGVAPAKHLGHLLAERFFGDFLLSVDMST